MACFHIASVTCPECSQYFVYRESDLGRLYREIGWRRPSPEEIRKDFNDLAFAIKALKKKLYYPPMTPNLQPLVDQIKKLTPEGLAELQAMLGKEEKLGEPWEPNPNDCQGYFKFLEERAESVGGINGAWGKDYGAYEALKREYNLFPDAVAASRERVRTRARRKLQRIAEQLVERLGGFGARGTVYAIHDTSKPGEYIRPTPVASQWRTAGTVYFGSHEACQQAIEAMGDDIKYLFY